MLDIVENQVLEVNNIVSFRSKIKQTYMEQVAKDMELKITDAGAKRIERPITATYELDGEEMDIEILLPIDKQVADLDKYVFKDKIKIVNAVVAKYKGHPSGLQGACNELNKYIMEHKLKPITVGYNVTKHIEPLNMDNTEIDVYVGISPNIL